MTTNCIRQNRPENFPKIKQDLLRYFQQHYLKRPDAHIIYFSNHHVVNEFLNSREEPIDAELIYRLRGALSFELRSFFRCGAIIRFSQRTFSIDLRTFPHQKFTKLLH